MNWQDIKWFHEVVVHESFSAAARASGTTQATISRRIKALESELGVDLFRRGPSGSQLTPAGQRLAQSAREMNASFEHFMRQHDGLRTESRSIIITCGALIGLHLSKNIGRLQDGLERVDIEVKTTSDFLDLDKGEADIALRNKRPTKGQLKSRRIQAPEYGPFSVFGNSEHYREHALQTLEALRREPWVGYASKFGGVPTARWVDENIGADKLEFRMSSAALILEVACSNRALAVLPRFIGLETPGLVEVYGPMDELFFEMWVVRRESSDEDPYVMRVIENIERLFH